MFFGLRVGLTAAWERLFTLYCNLPLEVEIHTHTHSVHVFYIYSLQLIITELKYTN